MRRLSVLPLVALMAAAPLLAACTPAASRTSSQPSPPSSQAQEPVHTVGATAPKGWVPVTFGDAQVSVPPDWLVARNDYCDYPRAPGTVFILGDKPGAHGCGRPPTSKGDLAAPTIRLLPYLPPDRSSSGAGIQQVRINGFEVEERGSAYSVSELGVTLLASGPGAQRIVKTLTWSPAAVVLDGGPAPSVPGGWRAVSAGGVRFEVPSGWSIGSSDVAPGGGCYTQYMFWRPSVLIDTDRVHLNSADMMCMFEPALQRVAAPVDGVILNLPTTTTSASRQRSCLHLPGLLACPKLAPEFDILYVTLVLSKHRIGSIWIGLAGNGLVARTILYSLRAA